MSRVHLPIAEDPPRQVSSLNADGSRNFVYPADVRGRFRSARKLAFAVLIAFWAALPWVPIGGHPAVFLDVDRRTFYLFGGSFNSQDIPFVFFFLTGFAFAMAFTTALAGRVWCGWACPQTVFLESLFRPIERLIEGNREARMRLDGGPWTFGKIAKKIVKHALFLLAASFVAHVFLAYFVSIPAVFKMVRGNPSAHPEAFAWATAITLLLYGNFAFFREQLCLVVCPYGRLQSVLVDADAINVGYDAIRGEPRGHAKGRQKDEQKGDCVDCLRCVAVCPTGIDIRNGMQLDCVACTQCIDACDEVMDKLKRPRGLIRYDSLNGLNRVEKRFLRPRLYAYAAFGLLGLGVATFTLHKHTTFESNLLRLKGPAFVLEEGFVRNAFEIHLFNKRDVPITYVIKPDDTPDATFIVPLAVIKLQAMQDSHAPLFVRVPSDKLHGDFVFSVRIFPEGHPDETKIVTATFLGPSPGMK
jgi:cytochrome c oxidase accessory protein FixG